MSQTDKIADFVLVGGGTAGCALATRLKQYNPAAKVVLLEAGSNEHENPLVTAPMAAFLLHGSKYEHNYETVPQTNYGNRAMYHAGGKMLSGSSACNYAMWTRGSRDDYDTWAEMVQDKRWSYDGMLPFFKKTETHYDSSGAGSEQHGFDGPIRTSTTSSHKYPLKEMVTEALVKGMELQTIDDGNSGDPIGVAPYTECWTQDGKRQPSGKAYGLAGVEVVTNATVSRVVFDSEKKATGVNLIDGRHFEATREVILCCGSIRTPQLLQLSGVGPKEELEKLQIQPIIDLPDVGRGLNDHCAISLFFKLETPEKGYAMGSSLWPDPETMLGMPCDVVAIKAASQEKREEAMSKDHPNGIPDDAFCRSLLKPARAQIEIIPAYVPTIAHGLDIKGILPDGTCISLGVLNLLPTSRGSIRLKSNDPTADPLIDPNYYATELDRAVMREAIRTALLVAEKPAGKKFLAIEKPPNGLPSLHSKSSDQEIDARVKDVAATWYHGTGTCAMGKVVDSDLRVRGTRNLRVVDVSVMPCPIAAHYMVAAYAIAEQAAMIVTEAWRV